MDEKKTVNFELNGVQVRYIDKSTDERGYFAEVARNDWYDLFGEKWFSQANLSHSYPGIIRAWHRHAKGQVDYFMVLRGAMKIVAYDGNKESGTYGKIVEINASEEKLQIVKIPSWLYYDKYVDVFVSTLHKLCLSSEDRFPWR